MMVTACEMLLPGQYPAGLNELPDPPKQLYMRGTLHPEGHVTLAVVGSRAATEYGKAACQLLVGGLAGFPVSVISGLAYGIDACAHRAALEAELHTIAVPGSGLDESVLYPRAHTALAREILESGGALLSEYDPKQQAAPWTFPRRNRIMVGLSRAVLMIEAKERSGTLITARLAAEYNRDLLVVPGSIFSSESRGSHQFLRLGATPITSPQDLQEALGFARGALSRAQQELSPEEKLMLEMLSEPCERDALIRSLEMSASDAIALLSAMEIKGLIEERLGLIRAL